MDEDRENNFHLVLLLLFARRKQLFLYLVTINLKDTSLLNSPESAETSPQQVSFTHQTSVFKGTW